MFEYNICNQYDEELFYKQCSAIENAVPGLEDIGLLADIDGTLVRVYRNENGSVTVKNDAQVDALYVISDFDLLSYFENNG